MWKPYQAASTEPFLVRYASDGGFVIGHRFPTVRDAVVNSIFELPTGGVLLSARYTQQIDLGGVVVNVPDVCPNKMLLAHLTDGLAPVWDLDFPYGPCGDPIVALGGSGQLIVSGTAYRGANVGTGPLDGGGLDSLFVATFDLDGGSPAAFTVASMLPSTAAAHSVGVLPDGGLVVAGEFTGVLQLGGTLQMSGALPIGFLAAYSPDGGELWSHTLGQGTGGAKVDALAIGLAGELYAFGEYNGTLNLAGQTFHSHADPDLFVARFDGDGTPVWATALGGSGADIARSIALEPNRVVVAGAYQIDFEAGGQKLSPIGQQDLFVAGIGLDGDVQWVRNYGTTGQDLAGALIAGADGSLFLAGTFNGPTAYLGQASLPGDGGVISKRIGLKQGIVPGLLLLRLLP